MNLESQPRLAQQQPIDAVVGNTTQTASELQTKAPKSTRKEQLRKGIYRIASAGVVGMGLLLAACGRSDAPPPPRIEPTAIPTFTIPTTEAATHESPTVTPTSAATPTKEHISTHVSPTESPTPEPTATPERTYSTETVDYHHSLAEILPQTAVLFSYENGVARYKSIDHQTGVEKEFLLKMSAFDVAHYNSDFLKTAAFAPHITAIREKKIVYQDTREEVTHGFAAFEIPFLGWPYQVQKEGVPTFADLENTDYFSAPGYVFVNDPDEKVAQEIGLGEKLVGGSYAILPKNAEKYQVLEVSESENGAVSNFVLKNAQSGLKVNLTVNQVISGDSQKFQLQKGQIYNLSSPHSSETVRVRFESVGKYDTPNNGSVTVFQTVMSGAVGTLVVSPD